MENINIEQFRMPDNLVEASTKKNKRVVKEKKVRKNDYGKFIIASPLYWVSKASHLSSKSLNVAMGLWYLYGLNKKGKSFKMEKHVLEKFNITAETYNLVLKKMEAARLITVERLPGQTPNIYIIEEEGTDGE